MVEPKFWFWRFRNGDKLRKLSEGRGLRLLAEGVHVCMRLAERVPSPDEYCGRALQKKQSSLGARQTSQALSPARPERRSAKPSMAVRM